MKVSRLHWLPSASVWPPSAPAPCAIHIQHASMLAVSERPGRRAGGPRGSSEHGAGDAGRDSLEDAGR